MSHVDEGTLHSYLDGELPSSERAAVEAHLAQCATCRTTLGEERALLERASALLGSARPLERPAPPFEQLRRSAKRSPRRLRTSFAWAASVALALGLGYYLRSPGAIATPPQSVVIAEDRAMPAPAQPAPASKAAQEGKRVPTQRESARNQRPESRTDELARGNARPMSDSPAAGQPPPVATGAVAVESAAPTRLDTFAAQRKRLLDQVVVTAAPTAAAGELVLRGGTGTAQWHVISRESARAVLGADPVGLPGLATRTIRRSPAPNATVVVEQALDSSTVIRIFQRAANEPLYIVDGTPQSRTERDRAAREAARAAAPAATDRLARFVGRLRVEISGPLSLDSLNRLLEQVEPLP